MTRIWALVGPTNVVTTTVTTGSRMYLPSACSMSLASAVGVLPDRGNVVDERRRHLAVRADGNGHDSSGLRQTMILTVSSGPIRYWKSDVAASRGAGG